MADSKTEGHYAEPTAPVPNGEVASDDEKGKLDHDEYSKAEKGLDATAEGEQVPWTFKRMVAIAALCIVYVGSQILLYFVSAGLTYIELDLNTQFGNWMLTANTLAVAAICPFVGYLTDLIGRRWVCVFGTLCLIVGSIVMGTAKSLGACIAAQAVGGIGAGICELTAIAGVAEISPQRWRGVTLSLVTFSIIPFMPQILYTVLIVQSSTWRWCFCLTGGWNFIGLIGLLLAYHPPPRHNVDGLTYMDILKRIDYFGAFLSIGGVTLFLVGLQAGGYQYPWTSGIVLGPLIVGILMIIGFPIWEWYGPHEYPMMPKAIFQGQRVVALAFGIVFIAGMDFYSILGFFPVTLQSVYHTSLIEIGVRALCYPWMILGGACIVSFLMSYTKGHVREMFLIAACFMTAFTAALARSTPDNPSFTLAMASLSSFGNGALVVPALTLALYACPDAYIGTTGALSLSSRFLGGSVGTSIYFNVFNNKIKQELPAQVIPVALKGGLSMDNAIKLVETFALANFEQVAPSIPGVTPGLLAKAIYARQWAFANSLKYVWYTTIPFGVISVLCCLALPNIRKYMTNRVAVDLH